MKTTALYCRVSTAEQRQDSQREELRAYCERRGWAGPAVAFYEDVASGARTSRPALERLLADVRRGRVERIVCFKLDRMGRSLTHLALILDELLRADVPLICTSQGIDTSGDNPAGRLQVGVLSAVAQFERELIRERVNAGLAAARGRGVKLGRPGTLGRHSDAVAKLLAEGKGPRFIGRTLGLPASSVAKIKRGLKVTGTSLPEV